MGISQGPSGLGGGFSCHRRSEAPFPIQASYEAQGQSSAFCGHQSCKVLGSGSSSRTMGSVGVCDSRSFGYPKRSAFQSPFLCPQKRWRYSPHPRPLLSEHVHLHSSVKDGISFQDSASHRSGHVGSISGCNRRISLCQDSSCFPKVFLFCPEWNSLYVPEGPLRSNFSSLGILQVDESSQETASSKEGLGLVFSRRLPDISLVEGRLSDPHCVDGESSAVARVSDQREEIRTSPSAINCLPGSSFRSKKPYYDTSGKPSLPCSIRVLSNNLLSNGDSSPIRISRGAAQLRKSHASVRQTVPDTNNSLDELILFSSQQRSPHSGECFFSKGFEALPRDQVFNKSDFFPFPCPIPGTYYGRLRLRLEWSYWQSQSARLVDSLGVFIPHKCERNMGYPSFNQFFPGYPVRSYHQDPYRQYGSIILFAEDGFSSFSSSGSSYTGFDFIMSPTKHFFCSCTHSRQAECTCRPGVPPGTAFHRVDVGSRILRFHLPKDFSFPSSGPLCYKGYCQVSLLHFPLLGFSGFPCGRLGSFLGLESIPVSLCFSSPRLYSSCDRKDLQLQGGNDSDCPLRQFIQLARKTSSESSPLGEDSRSHTPFPVCGSSSGHQISRRGSTSIRVLSSSPVDLSQATGFGLASSDGEGKKESVSNPTVPFLSPTQNFSFEGFSTPKASSSQSTVVSLANNFSFEGFSPQRASCSTQTSFSPARVPEKVSLPIPCPFPSRVSLWTEGLVARGYDLDVAALITKRYKASTTKQFQSGWASFGKFLTNRNLRLEDVKASTFGTFMGREFIDKKLATSTVLNRFYASIIPAKELFNIDLEKDEDIRHLISAEKKVRPGRRGVSVFPKWPLGPFLDLLNSSVFEPLEEASPRLICLKFMVLVFLNTGRRNSEISALIDSYYYQGDDIVLCWYPGFLAKMENGYGEWQSELPRISPILRGDKRLCPVRAFHIYIASDQRKFDPQRMWPYRKNALSCLVRELIKDSIRITHPNMREAEIKDLEISVHDLRKYACSYSRQYFSSPKEDLAKRVGSMSFTILESRYIRHVPRIRATFQVPLGTIYPTTIRCNKLRND